MAFADVIIDLSHHNGNVDLSKAQQSGIAGVIHKATQGLLYLDPMYQVNRQQAKANALLWGAYHFGTGDDGTKQADFFLEKTQPEQDTLLVLDFEGNPHGEV
jgi:lysozyme